LSSTGGVLANTYSYDSFGNLTSSTGSVTNPYQYTGRDYDPETGLRYYRARHYDPATGRFLSEDPLKFQTGVNHYVYVANDPINLYDPSGMRTRVCCRRLKGPEPKDVWSFLRKMGAKGSGQKHCFILVTGDEVPENAPDGTPTNGRITIALNRNEDTGEGEVHPWNFGSDKVPSQRGARLR
jgi:RHS repeat-associated protein